MQPKPRKKRRYHHGNLPTALLEVATEILDEEGLAALTLREVARRLGVTHAAPYRHFSDKGALVDAVAEEGLRELGRALARERAAGQTGDAVELRAVAAAYLAFARERPALFRAIFGGRLPKRRRRLQASGYGLQEEPGSSLAVAGSPKPVADSSLEQATREAVAEIERAVLASQARGSVRAGDAGEISLYVWAQCHGFATLLASGGAAFVGELGGPDALAQRIVEQLLAGLGPRRGP